MTGQSRKYGFGEVDQHARVCARVAYLLHLVFELGRCFRSCSAALLRAAEDDPDATESP